MIYVGDRRVYVNTGPESQTVKVCTAENCRGTYEMYHRRQFPRRLSKTEQQVEQQKTEAAIAGRSNVVELEKWLVSDFKSVRERHKETSEGTVRIVPPVIQPATPRNGANVGGSLEEIRRRLSGKQNPPADDPWVASAKDLVEQSIDQLVEQFIEFPYLHRVEHSIHAQLFWIMMAHAELAQRVPIGNDLGITQLVHKEWPETKPRPGDRRGNFDISVLSPKLVRECPSMAAFRTGRLNAPIVIEMGLDCDAEHLAADADKLMNSQPKHGYLIHLVRESPRDPLAEDVILGIESTYGIKTAYVSRVGTRTVFKRVNDQTLTER